MKKPPKAGIAAAQLAMAHILSKGQGRPANPVVSGKYMGQAAEGGDIYALHAAALLHLTGQGLPKNSLAARLICDGPPRADICRRF